MPADLKPLVVFPHPNYPSLSEIGDGIVFIKALWSGPAVAAYRALMSAVVQTNCRVPIYLFSADEVDYSRFVATYRPDLVLGGWGETFIVHNGEIVFESSGRIEHFQKLVDGALRAAFELP